MSFSSKVKNELCRIESKACCHTAELAGIIAFSGTFLIKEGKYILKINTENASVARRIFNLVKWIFNIHTTVKISKNRSSKKHMHSYSLIIDDEQIIKKVVNTLKLNLEGILKNSGTHVGINTLVTKRKCCKKAMIRGAFLGGGSISDPEKTYHFEFATNNQGLRDDFCKLLHDLNFVPGKVIRKHNYVIYFKGSEAIVDLLNIMGAHKSLLEFENIRIIKEMRNNVNRVVNCETANLGKTVNASVRQIQNIEFIKERIGLDKLPSVLQEIAEIRLEFKEATLKELGEILSPTVGKSGVNHRLRKLDIIAENLQKKTTI